LTGPAGAGAAAAGGDEAGDLTTVGTNRTGSTGARCCPGCGDEVVGAERADGEGTTDDDDDDDVKDSRSRDTAVTGGGVCVDPDTEAAATAAPGSEA